MEPAEVPTMTSTVRASKPKSCSSTASTPEWYAWPTTPPPPSTTPTRITWRACQAHGRVRDQPSVPLRCHTRPVQRRLLLVRHAEAAAGLVDADRPLTGQ